MNEFRGFLAANPGRKCQEWVVHPQWMKGNKKEWWMRIKEERERDWKEGRKEGRKENESMNRNPMESNCIQCQGRCEADDCDKSLCRFACPWPCLSKRRSVSFPPLDGVFWFSCFPPSLPGFHPLSACVSSFLPLGSSSPSFPGILILIIIVPEKGEREGGRERHPVCGFLFLPCLMLLPLPAKPRPLAHKKEKNATIDFFNVLSSPSPIFFPHLLLLLLLLLFYDGFWWTFSFSLSFAIIIIFRL